ncbi:MAG: hypothetical protein HOY76_08530, partial [Streptomyces sp.]|nr:hypothetical protein [Streptomyces sp.]
MRDKSLCGVVGRDPLDPGEDGTGAAFEALLPEVLDTFRRRLVESGNPLGADQDCWRICRRLAAGILAACARGLGHDIEQPPPGPAAAGP